MSGCKLLSFDIEQSKRLKKYAKCELHHILAELKSGRDHHLRHFIDSYFCYKNGYVVRTSLREASRKIQWNEYVSVGATQITKGSKSSVVKEHIVPINELTRMLSKLVGKDINIKSIKNIIENYTLFATITKKENDALNKHYRDKMPNKNKLDFKEKSKKSAIFSRYRILKIKLKKNDQIVSYK